jgi:Flp pilus assembly protein TadD
MRQQSSLARLLASAAVTAILAAGLGGCQTMSDITGSLTSKAEASPGADPRSSVDLYGERYRNNPKDAEAALAYGQALRSAGQRAQAVAVLEQGTIAHPGNKPLLAGYGRALADNGNFQQAFDVLTRAHSPDNPDWRILSVQGTALDQLGRHDEARRYYASALKIAPDEPSVFFPRICRRRKRPFAGHTPAPEPMRGCGRIWVWWLACRAVLPRPKAS